ncbi:hypothetical protein [Caballeronia novacaledonica]|uniref:hypothetical protein n=1 Tax=Caballeronia novacaledonica TaxID=1544861 RepID=UPI0011B26E6B|nr:hypothetical protein [Caballeronia novacaledonica]
MDETSKFRDAFLKVFFNRRGNAERVSILSSSGDKARDALCVEYCRKMVIPIPRNGTKINGELWRTIRIKADAVFTRT